MESGSMPISFCPLLFTYIFAHILEPSLTLHLFFSSLSSGHEKGKRTLVPDTSMLSFRHVPPWNMFFPRNNFLIMMRYSLYHISPFKFIM
jgi:hypothetical protein